MHPGPTGVTNTIFEKIPSNLPTTNFIGITLTLQHIGDLFNKKRNLSHLRSPYLSIVISMSFTTGGS